MKGVLKMKKFVSILLTFVIILVFAACNSRTEKPFAVITAQDCYENAGYIELIAGAEKSDEYIFTAENSAAVDWSIYVFDQEFDEGFRFIAQAAAPVLVGDGEISVAAGQFVYVYCSENEFTADAPNGDAKLKVTMK